MIIPAEYFKCEDLELLRCIDKHIEDEGNIVLTSPHIILPANSIVNSANKLLGSIEEVS